MHLSKETTDFNITGETTINEILRFLSNSEHDKLHLQIPARANKKKVMFSFYAYMEEVKWKKPDAPAE